MENQRAYLMEHDKGRKPNVFFPEESIWGILDAMSAIALRYVRGSVVEVGTSQGQYWTTTAILAWRAEEAGRKFYTCDIKKVTSLVEYEGSMHYSGSSFDFMRQYDGGPVAVVMLDGCHDYNVVIEEVKFFIGLLNPGGLLFMHDTYPSQEHLLERRRCSDSYRVRQEMEGWRDEIDCVTFPYTSHGMTMAIKKAADRPYFRK